VIDGDHLRAHGAPAALQDRPSLGATRRRQRQFHLEARRVLHHVRVGDDVAVGIYDHAGARAPLEHRLPGGGAILFVSRRIARDEDLHHARAHLFRKVLQRP
jgi:hypothetical protein